MQSLQNFLVKFRATDIFPSVSPVTTSFQNLHKKVQKNGSAVSSVAGLTVLQEWKRKVGLVVPFTFPHSLHFLFLSRTSMY